MKQKTVALLALGLSLALSGCASRAPAQQTPLTLTQMGEESDRQYGYAMEYPSASQTLYGEQPSRRELSTGEKDASQQQTEEMRAVWISYLDYASLMTGKTQQDFTANIRQAFQNVAEMGLNTVLVQVRPFGDALYPSQYFPWSFVATGEEGKDPGYDPLKIMVQEAKAQGLAVEAWVNPYRVRIPGKDAALCSANPVHEMLESGDAIAYQNGIYYNPASPKAQELIVNGVREIVQNYQVDGIHFDDYFYPTTDAAFDQSSYQAYQDQGGTLSREDWRRENVNQLVRKVYAAIKEINPQVLFGISPQGNMENNYNKQFIDVALWLSQPGYLDYICPQIYFGFENETSPYAQTVAQWNRMVRQDGVRLYVGLAPYKVGTQDTWAGSGKDEWTDTRDILARMVQAAREQSSYGGFALFRYDSLFHPAQGVSSQMERELGNLRELLAGEQEG